MPNEKTATSNPTLIDINGAADHLGTTPRHLRSLVFRREIPHVKIGGKLRFDPQALDAFVDSCRVPAAS
jgi:excisionase family DNA binding protein